VDDSPSGQATKPGNEPNNQDGRRAIKKWIDGSGSVFGKAKTAAAGFWIAVVLVCALGLPGVSTKEADHPKWKHVSEVQTHNQQLESQGSQKHQVKQVQKGQIAMWTDGIEISRKDLDTATTKRVRDALLAGDTEHAESLLQDAQLVHDSDKETVADYVPPTLTHGMADAVARGSADFYHLYLYDCCAQDGDVVRIQLNGESFATIPLTHKGVTLSVPVGSGTIIGLEGVRDGGGGITVSCRTSQGDHFTEAISPGTVATVAIVR